MRAAVQLEDAIVEVLDAEAEARDAHLADRGELGFGDRAGLAFERDLFGAVPRAVRIEPADEALQLLRRQERRRAAAEVDEVELASRHSRRRERRAPTRAPADRDTARPRARSCRCRP